MALPPIAGEKNPFSPAFSKHRRRANAEKPAACRLPQGSTQYQNFPVANKPLTTSGDSQLV
jgi:hypothetical protein